MEKIIKIEISSEPHVAKGKRVDSLYSAFDLYLPPGAYEEYLGKIK